MGILVATTGRLLLPEQLERQALTVAEHRMATREGGFDLDSGGTVDSLAELAAYAGVRLERDGDWLQVTTDHHGDPKWSEQAEEFYRSLAEFVQEGEIHLRAADGNTWSYSYAPSGMQEHGASGGDGGPAPADPVAPAAHQTPSPPPPASQQPEAPAGPSEPPAGAEPTAPPESASDFVDYPGRTAGPPTDEPPPPVAPAAPPGGRDAGWAGVDDDPPPAPPGRVLLMTVVLVVGVALIIGLALLASGF